MAASPHHAELHRIARLQRVAKLGDVFLRDYLVPVHGHDDVTLLQADIISEGIGLHGNHLDAALGLDAQSFALLFGQVLDLHPKADRGAFGVLFGLLVGVTEFLGEDVRQITEYAHANRIATDYHINETPMLEQDEHFKHADDNVTYIAKDDWPAVEETIQWLTEKQDAGYKMVNSNTRLWQMVDFMKGKHFPWNCRAGQNSMIIRVDGTLAPCFPMYTANYDWGVVGDHKFDTKQLDHQKESCQTHCFSTLNHILGWCYNDQRVIKYFFKQLAVVKYVIFVPFNTFPTL